ncbi:MAG: T9SS type A sorting domain-containing protein [Ignavibacteriaceae bacterium]|nr:T9SS type A sorting domain-containing protein [Ignavibacteriaceae bacterium]
MTGPVVVRMYLPQGVVITDYYKYGQTAVFPLPHWYQFMYDSQTGAEIIQQNMVDLHFLDGERGDNDITVNGYIVEPGGPVGSVSDVEDDMTLPFTFKLEQNYPNPFNPSTKIQYAIGSSQLVTLKIYDILGNEIATLVNEEKPAGRYAVEFIPSTINHHPASGVYFYQITAEKFIQTKKMIFLK